MLVSVWEEKGNYIRHNNPLILQCNIPNSDLLLHFSSFVVEIVAFREQCKAGSELYLDHVSIVYCRRVYLLGSLHNAGC